MRSHAPEKKPRRFWYCELHERDIYGEEFEWKGCWTCLHFRYAANFPYIDVSIAAEMLGVSKATVRRWVKLGKLKGRLFVKGRRDLNVPKRIYFIEASAVERLAKRLKWRRKKRKSLA